MRERGQDPRDRVPYVGSAAIHVVALVLVVVGSLAQPALPEFQTIQVNIVSEAAAAPEPEPEPAAPEELVVEEPDPTPPEPEEPPPVVEDDPPPREEVETPPPETRPTPPPVEEPPEEAAAEEGQEVAGEEIRVRLEGLQRRYPAYYDNIILQIRRCFRWRGASNLSAQLYFVIERDGTVSDDRVVQPSGNIRFDLEAIRAVMDCAGRSGRFGPLPEDLPYDRLPVLFTFHPPG